jgi:glutamate-ammonia-ligase adenylyltransferase
VLDTNTLAAIARLAESKLLPASEAEALQRAGLLYHRLTQVLRLCVDGPYDPAKSLSALNQLVASAAACPDIRTAESLVADTQEEVAGIFNRLIGNPA